LTHTKESLARIIRSENKVQILYHNTETGTIAIDFKRTQTVDIYTVFGNHQSGHYAQTVYTDFLNKYSTQKNND